MFCFSPFHSTWERSFYKRAARIPEVAGCGVKRPPLRKRFPCLPPTARTRASSCQDPRPIWKRGSPPSVRLHGSWLGDHPQPAYPQERREALSIVSHSEVFGLRPHGLNDVLIERGSFFLENKTRDSTVRFQGHSWGEKIKRSIYFVVSHVTQRNERSLENILPDNVILLLDRRFGRGPTTGPCRLGSLKLSAGGGTGCICHCRTLLSFHTLRRGLRTLTS